MHVIETLMGDDLVSLDFMAWKTNQFSLGFFNVLSARRSQFFPGRPKSTNNGAGDLYALWQSLAWTLLLDYRLNSSQLNKVYKQTRSSCDLPRYGRVMESKVSSLPATETWTGRGPSKVVHTSLCQITQRNANYKKKSRTRTNESSSNDTSKINQVKIRPDTHVLTPFSQNPYLWKKPAYM